MLRANHSHWLIGIYSQMEEEGRLLHPVGTMGYDDSRNVITRLKSIGNEPGQAKPIRRHDLRAGYIAELLYFYNSMLC